MHIHKLLSYLGVATLSLKAIHILDQLSPLRVIIALEAGGHP
jgi:hypothetical protein